ncbi:MAG: N-acetylgalactosamine-6-sulfatase [Planctomycetaceae bacterium]|nr:N-acetylgalactosamine-6-sulfatase [Planctomycetaceae bacterium]
MRSLLLTIIAIFVLATQTCQASKPNIVYILLDDAGYGDLSCYGQKKFKTPNIDRLASEGMKFTDHYAGSTVCAPTRCVLMTGKHTGHCFVRGNREVQPEGQAPMPADIVTLPKLLKSAGYATGAFGKWGLGAPGSVSDPSVHFDVFYGYNCQRQAHTYYPRHLWRNTKKVPLDQKTYSHDLINDQALKFIEDHKSGPFFCFMPVTIPHAAMHAPEEYVAPFRKKFPQFENKVGKYRGPLVKNPIAAFAGMMKKLDEGVGELLDLLRELGIDENTIVLLSSDNGPHREGGHDPVFFNSNGGLKGFKRDLFEGGIRVPLLARWPKTIKAGTTSNHISAHWDIMPTFLELAGAKTPDGIDGISFVPALLGKDSQAQHDYLYWEFYEQGGKKAARFGKWKAVQLNVNRDKNSPIQLFDLSKDRSEKNNIADANAEIVEAAKKIFVDAHQPSDLWKFAVRRKPKKK